MSFIEIRNFTYTYPGENEPVLKDIDFATNRGDFVVITGKSGCGKSTLGKALAGFLFQNSEANFRGKILVNQLDMTEAPLYEAIEKVAYVQQNPEDQFCTLNVIDEIAFGLENLCIKPEEIETRITEALSAVNGLHLKERDLSSLSGGEKQKVAIASLLALSPDVLILDEPTSNLDPAATQTIFQTLYDLRQDQDLTVIIIEHKLTQLMPFSPQIYTLEKDGLKNGTFEDLSHSTSLHFFDDNLLNDQLPGDNNQPVINLENINVSLQGNHILHNINLSIFAGEFIALMGPNGSGKSTLLRTLMGFHKLKSGKGTVFNHNVDRIKTSDMVNKVGFIFQNPDHQLFTQTVWDEITFSAKNLGIYSEQIKEKANQLLDLMNLGERKDDHPQRLSYGEKRRLNLASIILHNPKLLLIDELLIGQDMENATIWMKMLYDYAKSGNSVLLISHHADLTSQYCNRVIFMDQGRFLIDCHTSEAFAKVSLHGFQAFLPLYLREISYA